MLMVGLKMEKEMENGKSVTLPQELGIVGMFIFENSFAKNNPQFTHNLTRLPLVFHQKTKNFAIVN